MWEDIAGFSISLFSLVLSERSASMKHSYGYHRAEILGALASVSIVWAMNGIILVEAYHRFVKPQHINAPLMLLISILGLILNIWY